MTELKSCRLQRKMTQKEAAERIGISLRSYIMYENDESKVGTPKYRFLLQELDRISLLDENHGVLSIEDIKQLNPNLNVAGILLVKYDERTNIGREAKETLSEIAKMFDSKLFETKIRECIKAREAQVVRQTLINYARSCTTERDYEDFVEEYLGI